MKPVKTAIFNGKKYHIDKQLCTGLTDTPTDPYPAMYFPDGIDRTKDSLDTVIHESLHACFPKMREKTVIRCAKDITRFLWRLGYRKLE